MDYFQPSIPSKFIPFRLESATAENATTYNLPHAGQFTEAEQQVPESQAQCHFRMSSFSGDIEADNNAFAEDAVLRMEVTHSHIHSGGGRLTN